jgi:TPR repeat protein
MSDLKQSKHYFELAVELQPDYAAARDGLADMYGGSAVGWRMPPSEGFPKAEEYARKALALDDSLPEVHNTLAAIYWFATGTGRKQKQNLAERLR